jgi:hypothetical protein
MSEPTMDRHRAAKALRFVFGAMWLLALLGSMRS